MKFQCDDCGYIFDVLIPENDLNNIEYMECPKCYGISYRILQGMTEAIMLNNIQTYMETKSPKEIFELIDRTCPNWKVRVEYRKVLFDVLKNMGRPLDIF